MLLGRRVDVGPRPRALRPDVSGDLHRRRFVERTSAHGEELRVLLTLAVDLRAALGAEIAMQRAPAVRDRGIALQLALGELERLARQHGVDGAAGARDLLAGLAMAGAQLRDGHADRIADRAAKAAPR